jgi:hypothetical protein
MATPSDLRKQVRPDASSSSGGIHRKKPDTALSGSSYPDTGQLYRSKGRPIIRQNPMVAKRAVLNEVDKAIAAVERVIARRDRARESEIGNRRRFFPRVSRLQPPWVPREKRPK